MWMTILSFIGGPVVKGLIDGYKAKLAAGNTSEKIAADVASTEIAAQRRDVEIAASVVIAEQGRWYTACIRPLMAVPFIVFTWKVIIFDKVLGMGTTDALDPNMWRVFMAVVVAYFGGRSIEKVARILKTIDKTARPLARTMGRA
jgi:hypothetical protein